MHENRAERIYAFIDSQNLNLGIQSEGWKLDFKKFRLYLKNKFNVSKAYLFIGQVPGSESMYQSLEKAGFEIIFKPTLQYKKEGKIETKGNVDAELVLYAAAVTYNEYDKAIIVTGDGDFYCLIEFLENRHKLLKLLVPNNHYSSLLRPSSNKIVRIDQLRQSLQMKKTGIGGRSKP